MSRREGDAARQLRLSRPNAALLLIAAIALLLRVYPWFHAHVFLGVQEYDDGVYYAAAKALLHGAFPYRDFTIVHPPGSTLLLLPFAALGAVFGDPAGLASARVAIALIGVANTVLVYRLAQRLPRSGAARRRAALTAAALYAVMPNAVAAEHTVLLEPIVNLLCLLAVAALWQRQGGGTGTAVLAGALCAAAISVKLFAGAYVLALGFWLLVTRQYRLLLGYLAGVAAGGLLLLPLVLLDPAAFWHDVVVTQVSRPLDSAVSGAARFSDMAGLTALPVSCALGVLLLIAVLAAKKPAASGFWLGLSLLIGLAFLGSASYFPHYGAFLAPPLVLTMAACPRRPRIIGVLTSALLLIMLTSWTATTVRADLASAGQGDLRRVSLLVAPGSCVFAENASTAIAADLLSVSSAQCPTWVDGRGVSYAGNTDWPRERNYYFAGFTGDARWQRALRNQLAHADFLLISRPPGQIPEWDALTRAYAVAQFQPVLVLPAAGRGRAELWQRTVPDPAPRR